MEGPAPRDANSLCFTRPPPSHESYRNHSMGRPLWLHISALSPDEYDAYPPALEDIATIGQDVDGAKDDWESRSVSVLVAKGWMKGRYRDQVDGEVVEKILRYFCPNLSQKDTLSAGQFFAALRLISHAQRGHAPEKSLVFIQARLSNEPTGRTSPHKAKSLHNLRSLPPAPIRPAPIRPLQLSPDEPPAGVDDRHAPSSLNPSPVRELPKSAPAAASSNPFRRTLSTPGDTTPNYPPDAHPPLPHLNPALIAEALASSSALADEDGSPIVERAPPSISRSMSTKTVPESPSNPFRRTSHSPAPPPVRSQSPPLLPRRPPLPPRAETNQQPMLPPPRHPQQPPKPPKPSASSKPKPVLMPPAGGTPSELIKQSLRAAKGAQRASEMSLEKQRTWEVIKSSTHHSESRSNAASGGVAQALAQLTASNLRTLPQTEHGGYQSGPSTTSSSLNRVATARPDPIPPLPPLPPKPASHHGHSRTTSTSHTADNSTPGRPTRSKSLHHSPSQTPPQDSPIQPPPRRRPESIQFTGAGGQKHRAPSPSPTPNPTSLSRRASLARSHAFDEVRRRAGELEPRLDAVRAKAEGKLTSRGFMTRRGMGEQGEPLVDLDDGGSSTVDGDVDWREWDRDDDAARRFRSSPSGLDVDRDVPTSDLSSNGWRPLPG